MGSDISDIIDDLPILQQRVFGSKTFHMLSCSRLVVRLESSTEDLLGGQKESKPVSTCGELGRVPS